MPNMGGMSDALRLVSRMSAAMRSALLDQWQAACEFRPSLLVYHPKMLGGLHIAERLQVPAVVSLPLPFLTPTRAFPIPFIAHWPFGGSANKLSYQFNRFTAVAYGEMINSFRRKTLGLSGMSRWSDYLRFPDGRPVPVLYGFSSHVVPVPEDYPAHAHVTGYWFLDEPETWHPPTELVEFLAAGEAPVYIGFGSMGFGKHARTRGQIVVGAVEKAKVRAWSLPAGAVSSWTRCPTVCTSSKRSRTPGCSPGLSAWYTMAEQEPQLPASWRLVPVWSVPCWVIRVSGRSECTIWAWVPHRCRCVD
jgi:sterol 3beta-glucosyltransferase